jgi:predicted TIM-barrel fold metal-dependent hydrolase
MNRRQFLGTVAASAAIPALQAQASGWSSSVLDLHHHMRPKPEANIAHLDGAGITKANLLTRGPAAAEQVKANLAAAPGRYIWFSSADITKPEAVQALTQSVKDGAQGFGELKFHVAADGPELTRMYDLAAELNVPVLVHFQEVDHFENEGKWSSGFAQKFESVLKAHPKTKFIAHADAFWANVSADYHNEAAYPSGPIKKGGISDKLLSDYANFYGDCSANSGNNALSRDPEFTPDFLKRHQDKLMFGSDCSCTDGHGAGISQQGNPAAARLAGKCVARETLTVLTKFGGPAIFKKIAWDNAHKLFKIPA